MNLSVTILVVDSVPTAHFIDSLQMWNFLTMALRERPSCRSSVSISLEPLAISFALGWPVSSLQIRRFLG